MCRLEIKVAYLALPLIHHSPLLDVFGHHHVLFRHVCDPGDSDIFFDSFRFGGTAKIAELLAVEKF